MNILTNLIRLLYLVLGTGAIIFVSDYTRFDNEYGPAYHEYIKEPLVEYELLKKREGSSARVSKSIVTRDSKDGYFKIMLKGIWYIFKCIVYAFYWVISTMLDKLVNVLFLNPITLIYLYFVWANWEESLGMKNYNLFRFFNQNLFKINDDE